MWRIDFTTYMNMQKYAKKGKRQNKKRKKDDCFCFVGDFAYQRKDGVYVVPIGCLKD